MKKETVEFWIGECKCQDEDDLLIQLYQINGNVIRTWNQGDKVFFLIKIQSNLILNSSFRVRWDRMKEIDSVFQSPKRESKFNSMSSIAKVLSR